MRITHTTTRAVAALVLALAAALGVAAPASAQQGGCSSEVYFELDAHGLVTAYPAARCATNGPYKSIRIDASLEVDGTPWVDRSSITYKNRSGGVIPGVGVRGRNGEGSNQFCAITTVEWSHPLGRVPESRTGRSCATF